MAYRLVWEDGQSYSSLRDNGSALFLLEEVSGDLRMNMSHVDLMEKIGQHEVVIEVKKSYFKGWFSVISQLFGAKLINANS